MGEQHFRAVTSNPHSVLFSSKKVIVYTYQADRPLDLNFKRKEIAMRSKVRGYASIHDNSKI